MDFADIVVVPLLSALFQEVGYVVRRQDAKACFIIDPGLESFRFSRYLTANQLRLEAILVTHGHGDHIGGIAALREKWTDAKIYIGELDKEKLTDPVENLSAAFGVSVIAPPADVLLHDGDPLTIADIPIEVRHVPGHCKGHMVYLLPTKPKGILFAGDVIFQGNIGRSDFPDSEPAVQIPMLRSKVLSLPDDTVIYSGHGEATTVGAEKRFNPFLR